jgi:hypothetical protein
MPRLGKFSARALTAIARRVIAFLLARLTPAYVQSGSTLYLRDVTYGNNRYVAVGSNAFLDPTGYVTSSADGITWSTPALFNGSTVPFYIEAVTYGNGLFVASGRGTTTDRQFISTSTNGITWSTPAAATTASSRLFYPTAIGFGNNRFVAVGGDSQFGIYSTSTNGYSWSTATSMPFGGQNCVMLDVTYTGERWVAVGSSNSQYGVYSTSTNGSTWAPTSGFNGAEPYYGGYATSVAANTSGTCVAVGGLPENFEGPPGPTLFSYSVNHGESWTTPTVFPDTSGTNAVIMNSIVYTTATNQFLAVGRTSTGTMVYATSTNGISWNGLYEIAGIIPANPQAVAANSAGSQYVAVGFDFVNEYPTHIYI